MAIFDSRFTFCVMFVLLPLAQCASIRDLLRSKGLPAGLFPKEVKSYTLDDNARLQVFLNAPCMTKFENRVFFDRVVRANISHGQLSGVEGMCQEELFLWFPVKGIILDDPASGVILFDIGLVHNLFSLSLFEDPPDCEPEVQTTSGRETGMGKGFEVQ